MSTKASVFSLLNIFSMAENITLVSQNYATGKFQSKLTEANQGDNITITGEGDSLKINAEVPDPTVINSSDESINVTPTETGYDLKVDDNKFIGRGEYTVLEDKVKENADGIDALASDVNTVQENIRDLNTQVATIENDVNRLDRGKQDALTAGANITISADNVISAAGGSSDELKYKTFLVMVPNDRDYMPDKGDSANYLGYNIVVKDSYYDMIEDGWRMFKFDQAVTCSMAQQLVFEASFTSPTSPDHKCIKESVYHYYKDSGSITQPFPFISSFIGLEQHEWYTVTNNMFTKVYGTPATGDGTVSVGQNQTVLLPADKTHIRAVPGDKVGGSKLLGMIIGVKPNAASPADEKSMIAAFTYFSANACQYAHLNNGTTIPLSETSGNYIYAPGGMWSGKKNPFIDCLGNDTSTAPFELEKVDRYKIKVTNLAENRVEEIDVSSWPFFQEGGEIRFGFCGYNGNNSGMTVNNIEYFD